MITTITKEPRPYVLESERGVDSVSNETIFWIVPKTVKGSTESAAKYAKALIEKKRTGRRDIDVQAMQMADDSEWVKAVVKIENMGIENGSEFYNHFLAKSETDPSVYIVDEKTGLITVTKTEEEIDRKYIFHMMSIADTEEIMLAYVDYTELKLGIKNS